MASPCMVPSPIEDQSNAPVSEYMWCTCLRHVPDDLYRKLKARAALVGLPLSDYLLQKVRRVAERPTIAELRSRLARRPSVTPTVSPAKAVRAEREGR